MSLIDDSFVTPKTVGVMLVYLLTLCIFLGYCLITFWPSPAPLIVSAIEPTKGQTPDTVTISGSGFTEGMKVSFDNPAPTDSRENLGTIVKNDNTSLVVKLPKHDLGEAQVTIKDLNGQTVVVPKGFFKFIEKAPPAPSNSRPANNANAPDANSTGASSTASPAPPTEYRSLAGFNLTQITFLHHNLMLRQNVQILLIVMIVGALGSLIHVFRSFYWYVGNRTLKNSWLLMYVLLPFDGAGLAVLFYLILGGNLSSQAPANPSSVYGNAAVAALVGMFSQEALIKLKQIAAAFFTPSEQGKDPAIPAVTISGISPAMGPIAGAIDVTITGTGFAPGIQVTFGGASATNLRVTNSNQLIVTIPPHTAGVVDVVVTNSAGHSSTSAGGFTYQ